MSAEPLANANANTSELLRQYVERIERLEEEKSQLSGDIRDLYAEAKGYGLNPKVMRQVIRLRAMDSQERQESDAVLELYRSVLDV